MHLRDLYTSMTIEDNSAESSQEVPTPSRNKLPPLKNVRTNFLNIPTEDEKKRLSNTRPSLTVKITNMNHLHVNTANPDKQRATSVNFLRMQHPDEEIEKEQNNESEEKKVRRSQRNDSLRNCEQDYIEVPERASSINECTPRKSILKLRSITSPMSPNRPGIIHDSRLPPTSPKLRFKFDCDGVLDKRPVRPSYNDLRVIICYRGRNRDSGFTEKWIKVPKKGLYKFDIVSLIDPDANQQKIVMENASWIVLSRVSTQTKLLYLKLWSCITAILFFLPMDHKKKKYPEVNIHIPIKGMSKADFCTLIQPAEDPDNLIVEGWDKTFTSLETFDVYSIEWIVRDERVVMLSRRPKALEKREESGTKKFHQLRSAFTKRIRRTSL